MPAPLRHLDRGTPLSAYADDVLVRCVDCATPGRVVTRGDADRRSASFGCARCGLHLDSREPRWVGPVALVGQRACGHCGHRSVRVDEPHEASVPKLPSERPAACPQCGRTSSVQVAAMRRLPIDGAIDPHFGLPLLLVQPCRHGTVWAYGETHLRELRAYVASRLRERRGAGNGSMFSRLPVWMKRARHRDEILAALERLDAQLRTLDAGRRR